MLGPFGRSTGVRTRHRRRWWLTALAVVVVCWFVGEVAYDAVNASGKETVRTSSSWVAAVGPMVDQSNALQPTLARIRDAGTGMRRTELDTLLTTLVEGSEEVRTEWQALALPAPSAAAAAELAATIGGRAQAAVALSGGLTLAVAGNGAGSGAVAAAKLAAAGRELVAADTSYRRLRRALPKTFHAERLPPSQWIPDPSSWRPAATAVWVSVLSHAPGMSAVRSISIVAVSLQPRVLEIRGLPTTTTSTSTTTTTPKVRSAGATGASGATGSSGTKATTTTTSTTTTTTSTTTTLQLPPAGSVSVVQPTSKVHVSLVLASTGNLAATGVVVTATLTQTSAVRANGHTAATGNGSLATVTRTVGSLAPGAARYLLLPALSVHAGASYRLVVSATFSGGTRRTDTIDLSVSP